MKEQKLTKVEGRLRTILSLTTSSNRRMAENWQREQKRRQGRGVCTWCGAQSCGHLWSRPSEEIPAGERCCDRCSHEPVEGWQHTHTAWDGNVAYPVCGIVMREGDVVYMRRDGVVEFLEMRAPAPGAGIGGAQLEDVPTVAFLGHDGGVALYVAGEGDPDHVNLWEKKRDLDVVWLPIRIQASVARDEARKARLAVEIAEAAAAWERQETERREAEAKKRAADIEKRQLQHETVTVLRELEEQGGEVEMPDDGSEDEAAEAEEAEAAEAVEPAKAAAAPEPARKLTRAELKQPAPVKKGPGRPKRSKRQRDARKRQKRAWAVAEARQRLEVKRLERLGRSKGPEHDKEDG